MELNESLLDEIKAIFNSVSYGKIIFAIAPDKPTLDYTIESTHKLRLKDYQKNTIKHLTGIK